VYAYTYFSRKESREEGIDENEKSHEAGESATRHGGGKNAQHGKAEPKPSDLKRLKELEEQLKNASGRKEKTTIGNKINNLRKKIDKDMKGENHSQRAKT
jgi:hypothetical protein